jgi:hypothetical protein
MPPQSPPVENASLAQRQRQLIARLVTLDARRQDEGGASSHRQRERNREARAEYERLRDEAAAQFEQQHAALVAGHQAATESITARYEFEGLRLAHEEQACLTQSHEEMRQAIEDAKTLRQHQAQQIVRAYKQQKAAPKNEYLAFKQRCLATAGEVQALVARAQHVASRRCEWPETAVTAPPPPPGLNKQQYLDRFAEAFRGAFERLVALENRPAARFIEDKWPLLIFLFSLAVTAYPAWLLLGRSLHWLAAVVGCLGTSVAIALASRQIARPLARRQTQEAIPGFQAAISEARGELAAAVAAAKAAADAAHRALRQQRDADLAAAKAEYKKIRREAKAGHAARMQKTAQECAARRSALEDKYEAQLDAQDEQFPVQLARLEQSFTQQLENLEAELSRRYAESHEQAEYEQAELTASWKAALADFQAAAADMNELCRRHFPAWNDEAWSQWPGASAGSNPAIERSNGHSAHGESPLLPLGEFELALGNGNGNGNGSGSGGETAAAAERYRFPAALSYPHQPSLFIKAEGAGREAATRVLQNAMLRLLTALPPGKVRFTIIDPVGLGQNFSAFMHLADYDEKLVNSRIWTEGAHIQRRLADLTEHMENVIQKYLRNEFASIQEYNEQAGEVAEPFQILVVANFPANFSEEAAARLASIAASGARCGVYTLISADMRLALPRNFQLDDLASQAATLVWNNDEQRFQWAEGELQRLPLALEEPPPVERFTEIVRAVGRLAKDAARVEVPFEMVTPEGPWWSADSRGGIEIPLGRAGAKNLQHLRLGQGTSQHVLISGKTGSGKSTLLNALITNLALHYSPAELEFYLIDFKKGVEFKAYAAHQLPHARVIAIESEREFGLSVLERLDQELKRRGDLFRQAGVQDLKGYRQTANVTTLPRALLIIDEFQEFFTSDDRIAHDASLLLDRLVRQGRAFGIHVLLGSQTLAGAYSLARSTLGQMAVRIALQCSEADAHLILSEDNSAARLLSRPGEAIYNDANGLIEGNHPFQIVWLADDEREQYLERVAQLAAERRLSVPPPIVFEGSAAADPSENRLLQQTLETPPAATRPAALKAWLGAAVAIKDPTEAIFRPQGGSNLLVVGQQEQLALGCLAVGMVGLAAQLGPLGKIAASADKAADSLPRQKRFYVLDGTRPDAPEAGFWGRLCQHKRLDAALVPPRDAAQAISELAAEVDRRVAAGGQAEEPVFLVIYNLARFRDLKKSEDYSFDDDGAAVAKKLTTILREGPPVGVHTLVWCDSYTTASRWLDRQALRDFDMRVLFQMSAADSSNLMDSPAASRLGPHGAFFYSEERGQAEKFRPYGLPENEWLEHAARAAT